MMLRGPIRWTKYAPAATRTMTRTRRTFFSMSLSFPGGRRLPVGVDPRRDPREADQPHRDVGLLRTDRDGFERLARRIDPTLQDRRLLPELRLEVRALPAHGFDRVPGARDVARFLERAAGAAGRGGGAAERRGLQHLPPHEGVEQRGSDRDGGLDLLLINLLGLARLGGLGAAQTLREC